MTNSVSVDEFQALEQRVLRTVELIRSEREQRSVAEQEITALKELLDHASGENEAGARTGEKSRGCHAEADGRPALNAIARVRGVAAQLPG